MNAEIPPTIRDSLVNQDDVRPYDRGVSGGPSLNFADRSQTEVARECRAEPQAKEGWDAEVRYFGEIETTAATVERFVRKLERKSGHLHFCYEAGPTGYGLYRQLVALGHRCDVVVPSLIPPQTRRRSGQDQPARRGQPGTAVADRRADWHLGSRRGR